MRHDKDEVLRGVTMEGVAKAYGVELITKGAEYVARCPFHADNSPSFTITPENKTFYCFGCGAGGDPFEFVMRATGCTFPEALDKLADMSGAHPIETPAKRPRGRPGAEPCPDPLCPPPASLRVAVGKDWISMPVTGAWPYYDTAGNLWGYTCRVEPEPGKKDVIPVTWRAGKWAQGALPEPRWLYGSELLRAHPETQVLIVEGEKTADAARRLLPGALVLTWPGGCKAVAKANWSLIAGRKAVGWPDADEPGMAAMVRISDIHNGPMRIVRTDPAWPQGWDLADAEAEGWTTEQVRDYIKANLCEPAETQEPDDMPPVPQDYDAPPSAVTVESEPFRVLGWDRGEAYYLPRDSKQIISITAAAHTRLNLLSIAPLYHWMREFEAQKRSGPDAVDWTLAADAMMRRAKKAGIFDRDVVRGLGAWWDDGRCAVHLGNRVILDGQSYGVDEVPSKYIYEQARTARIGTSGPASNSEAYGLIKICEALRWESPVYGKLCAGWIFLAPICGALDWRPHIWITGEPGSGKTTIVHDVIKRALARNIVMFLGDTTEAGVRQTLGCDALPVLFDEFESERKKSASRVEDVMSLITQASSETEGVLAKGGAGGKATTFRIRSMFCFSSVAVSIKQAAARSRITVLSVKTAEQPSREGIAQYNRLMADIIRTMTPEFIDAMQARAVSLIPVIRKNAITFAEAAAMVAKTRRFGDQVGTLLAGAYALHSGQLIDPAEAQAWIEAQDWSEQTQDQEVSDKADCLSYITSHVLRVQDNRDRPAERTVGELIRAIATPPNTVGVYEQDAQDALGRCGIKVAEGSVYVAQGHRYLEKMLADTPWESSYPRTLLRLEGARRSHGAVYFAGVRKRAILVPVAHATGDEK